VVIAYWWVIFVDECPSTLLMVSMLTPFARATVVANVLLPTWLVRFF